MQPLLRIGTRGSRLALVQSRAVESLLRARCEGLRTELVVIKTEGDVKPDEPLAGTSGQGIFTRELDRALLEGRIDLAVHSLKDLPTEIREGLELAAVSKREEGGDAFLSNRCSAFDDLPAGAVLGTGSPRRKAQILARRPDLKVEGIRGNVETRIRKLDEGLADAVILACAGLIRLGFEVRITERLPLEAFVPAPGQGALALTVRERDARTAAIASLAHDRSTARAVDAERAFLLRLGGGCRTPIACHGRFKDNVLEVTGFVATPDGKTVFQERITGEGDRARALGEALAEKLLARGAKEILVED
jgi:hydroxymethylbilane synthase